MSIAEHRPRPSRSVIISGRLCAGKTTLACSLVDKRGFLLMSARALLRLRAERDLDSRSALQEFGRTIDRQTRGRWLADAVSEHIYEGARPVVIDSVRTRMQLRHVRDLLGSGALHVHLTAEEAVLRDRFLERDRSDLHEPESLEAAMQEPIELTADSGQTVADLVIDTTSRRRAAVLGVVLGAIDQYTSEMNDQPQAVDPERQ